MLVSPLVLKETLDITVSLKKKALIINFGKKCEIKENISGVSCSQSFIKIKFKNKRAGDDLRCPKSLESIFSKQEILGWPLVLKRDHISYD